MTDLEREACRVLASIATIDEDFDGPAEDCLHEAIADAQAFFRMNGLRIADFTGAPKAEG